MFELHARQHHGERHFEHSRGRRAPEASATCPLCQNHCSLDAPGCGRGMAFTQGENNMENFKPGSGGHIMSLLHHMIRRMSRARHERGNAQHAQLRALSIIAEQSPMSQRDLLEELDVRSSSLSELLAKLERASLVERERDDADRRNFIVKITDEGRKLLEGHANGHQHGAEAFFDCFTDEEREQFAALLQKLNDSREKLYPCSGDFPEGHPGFHRHGRPHMGREGRGFGQRRHHRGQRED